MAEFERLSMQVEEARRLAKETERANHYGLDWYVARLEDDRYLDWADFIPRLRREHAASRDVEEQLHALAAGHALPNEDGRAPQMSPLLRLRANLALLALGIDAGLGPVAAAIEGQDEALQSLALRSIPDYGRHLWPDRYYEALFASCARSIDNVNGFDRHWALELLFDKPIPALAPAIRVYLASDSGLLRRRAALSLLCQEYENEARNVVSQILAWPFPEQSQERGEWYRTVKDLMRETVHCYKRTRSPATRTWAVATVLILVDRLVGAARVEGEPDIEEHYSPVSDALYAIDADIPVGAAPLLARWAQAHPTHSWRRTNAILFHASHAGAAGVSVLLEELKRLPVGRQGALARELRLLAPASDYATLAPTLRACFDAYPPQETDSYGHSDEQDDLAAIGATLVQFDPAAAAHVASRLAELGPAQQREVRWALRGLTTGRIAALLAEGGAVAPFAPGELASFSGDGHLVRGMLLHQARLVIFNSRDDINESTAMRVVKALAAACVPAVQLDAVTEDMDQDGVRFIHAGAVFEIRGVGDESECDAAAEAFNAFLADIGHPQRVFEIGDDDGSTDNDIGAFFCADPVRMLEALRQLDFPAALAADRAA